MLSACRHIFRLPEWELDIILQTQLTSFPANWNLGKSGLPVNWPWFNALHGHALTDLNGHFYAKLQYMSNSVLCMTLARPPMP